uniref:hypothetical protein n=1 Tax=Cellvibrio fontiphilus TaxID=1815559 RepID=UPI002B4C0BD4|nr:hypothetical protein [Cellvibrio fontiphilus]
MLQSLIKSGVVVVVASLWSMVASAGTISCGNQYRTASLTSAELCFTGSGNTKESDIESYFGGDWDHLGGVAGAANNNASITEGYLTVTLTSGTWGATGLITGTWAIDSSFWTVYGKAALSVHVGNGKYDPDHFAWTISEGNTSGTWYYERLSGNGGGLSNMHLWGSGEPATQVSEPNVALLLMLGLLSMFVARRRV